IRVILENEPLELGARNILICHQFITGAEPGGSEELTVGGLDSVSADLFDCFDYVALGHIHGPQNIGSERVRYCGTPLKYSFSESKHKKSVTVVEMGAKDSLEIRTIVLEPKRDMREIKGTYAEITLKDNYINTNIDDYMHITLTDEEDIPDAIGKLRVIYPNLMKLDYDNKRTRSSAKLDIIENIEQRSPLDLFAEFYENQNNQPMTDVQSEFMKSLIESIWEGEK
ncbi:MAG: exonuclease SbcCD subunit D C-terminal domain-containing protein, partial [Clostridia bacterium]|nr:exonuclease SbcCD subunit D C-terminal domain-containing protein [Clostridia bacterium]